MMESRLARPIRIALSAMLGFWILVFDGQPTRADAQYGPYDGLSGDGMDMGVVRAAIRRADIVLLGEVHDNPHHHELQGLALTWMASEEDGRLAVVFEMLTRDQQVDLDAFDGTAKEFGPAMAWEDRGWPSAALYMPVFQAALQADARLIAADLPRAMRMHLYSNGPDSLPADVRAVYDLLEPLPDALSAEMADIQFEAHCRLMPRDAMASMVTVQRARDAALAEAALNAHRTGDGPVAVILGAGHARLDHGVGRLVHLWNPDLSVLAIGFTEHPPMPGEEPFDIVWLTEPVERPDPCKELEDRLTVQ